MLHLLKIISKIMFLGSTTYQRLVEHENVGFGTSAAPSFVFVAGADPIENEGSGALDAGTGLGAEPKVKTAFGSAFLLVLCCT